MYIDFIVVRFIEKVLCYYNSILIMLMLEINWVLCTTPRYFKHVHVYVLNKAQHIPPVKGCKIKGYLSGLQDTTTNKAWTSTLWEIMLIMVAWQTERLQKSLRTRNNKSKRFFYAVSLNLWKCRKYKRDVKNANFKAGGYVAKRNYYFASKFCSLQ